MVYVNPKTAVPAQVPLFLYIGAALGFIGLICDYLCEKVRFRDPNYTSRP